MRKISFLILLPTILLFLNETIFAQVDVINCRGLVIYNYTRDINTPFYVHFRSVLIEKLNCNGGLIDHTKNSTISNLNNRYGIDETTKKIKNSFPTMEKILFLEYTLGEKGKISVYGTILSRNGTNINSYSQQFDIDDIDEALEREKRPIENFALEIMNRKIENHVSSFQYPGRFNILISNFNITQNCPKKRANPETVISDKFEKYFDNDIVEVLIDDNSTSVNSSEEADIRGRKKGADIVIWSDRFEKICNEGENAIYHYQVTGETKVEFIRKSESSDFNGVSYLNDIWLPNKIGRIIYWILGKEAYNKGNKKETIEYLVNLKDEFLSEKSEKSEKYYLLGNASFSNKMDNNQFYICKKYFNKSIDFSKNAGVQKNWLNLLTFVQGNLDISKLANDEFKYHADLLLNRVGREYKNFPNSIEDYIFCIDLAKNLNRNDDVVRSLIEKSPKDSYKILTALMSYYDVLGEQYLAEDFANKLIENFPQKIDGFDYLAKLFEGKREYSKSLEYANEVKDISLNNADNYIRLARLHKMLGFSHKDECYSNYMAAVNINPSLKNPDIEVFLGLSDKIPYITDDGFTPKTPSIPIPAPEPDCGKYNVFYSVKFPNQNFQQVISYFKGNFGIDIKPFNPIYKSDSPIGRGTTLKIHDGKLPLLYTVQQGDILQNIANTYSKMDSTLDKDRLAKLNGLESSNNICKEQILLIKKGCSTSIFSFDRFVELSEAAKRLNLTEDELIKLNGNVNHKCRKKNWITKE